MTENLSTVARCPVLPTAPGHAGARSPAVQRSCHAGSERTDRRATPRSVALEFRAWIGWWAGETFVVAAARLLDISRGGVAVVAEDAPECEQDVWFCLQTGEKRDSVKGDVVDLGPGVRGRYLIRIAFCQPCPDRLFRVATLGHKG